jgi:hypothetical protein
VDRRSLLAAAAAAAALPKELLSLLQAQGREEEEPPALPAEDWIRLQNTGVDHIAKGDAVQLLKEGEVAACDSLQLHDEPMTFGIALEDIRRGVEGMVQINGAAVIDCRGNGRPVNE